MDPDGGRVCVDETAVDAARALDLGLPRRRDVDAAEDWFLIGESEGALDLRPPREHDRPGVRASFPPDPGAGRREPLVRAFGPRVTRVHDLTAGLGGDAYRLARAGHAVHACERNAAVFAVLASGWARACAEGRVPEAVAERLHFVHEEARAALERIDGLDEGVLLDPMYPPPRRASAKPRRALQVLRALLGAQPDAGALLAAARPRVARVVVKRPPHAAPLAEDASFDLGSKLVRFDVYVNPARMRPRSDADEAVA